jgi:hypothetical protein
MTPLTPNAPRVGPVARGEGEYQVPTEGHLVWQSIGGGTRNDYLGELYSRVYDLYA